MQCDAILENLYVGSHPSRLEDVDRLKQVGVTVVLNLQSDDDFQHHRIQWRDLFARYCAVDLTVHRVPIGDFNDADLREKLPEAVHQLASLLTDGETVFVHCTAGLNRAPSVIIAYLHWIQHWPLGKSTKYVKKRHPCLPAVDVIRKTPYPLDVAPAGGSVE